MFCTIFKVVQDQLEIGAFGNKQTKHGEEQMANHSPDPEM